MRLSGRKLSAVLRTHELNDGDFWTRSPARRPTRASTRPLLAGPMRYLVKTGVAEASVESNPLRVVSAADHAVVTEGDCHAGNLRAGFRDTWDYDGTVKVELTLQPTGGR